MVENLVVGWRWSVAVTLPLSGFKAKSEDF
jgi:hypothetical protein